MLCRKRTVLNHPKNGDATVLSETMKQCCHGQNLKFRDLYLVNCLVGIDVDEWWTMGKRHRIVVLSIHFLMLHLC